MLVKWVELVVRLIFLGLIIYMFKRGLNEIKPFLDPKCYSGIVTLLVATLLYISACFTHRSE